MRIRKLEMQKISKWSGGETTELFIYPSLSQYSSRDFEYRISSATIESEMSTFTSFEGYERILMTLTGDIVLHIDGVKRKVKMHHPVRFSGSSAASSFGKVTDFNLIFKKGYSGDLVYKQLPEKYSLKLSAKANDRGVYIYKGKMIIDNQIAVEGDFVVLDEGDEILSTAVTGCELVVVKVVEHGF